MRYPPSLDILQCSDISNYCFIQCLNDHNNKTVIKERMCIVPLWNFRRVFYCLHNFINDTLLSFSCSWVVACAGVYDTIVIELVGYCKLLLGKMIYNASASLDITYLIIIFIIPFLFTFLPLDKSHIPHALDKTFCAFWLVNFFFNWTTIVMRWNTRVFNNLLLWQLYR